MHKKLIVKDFKFVTQSVDIVLKSFLKFDKYFDS